VSKFTIPSLIYNFDFEFLPGTDRETFKMPHNNMVMSHQLKIDLLMTQTKRTHVIKL
jgi:hypothetical protein